MLSGGSATIVGDGKILYDTLPSFLNSDNTLVNGTAVSTIGNVSFDYLTKGGTLSGGTYVFTAGTVRDLKGGTNATSNNGILTGSVLRLEPEKPTTRIKLSKQVVNFSGGIVAGTSDASAPRGFGTISIGTLAYAPSLTIRSGVTVLLDTNGSLSASLGGQGVNASEVRIQSGTFVVFGGADAETVANSISGTEGTLRKTGSGSILFSGTNTSFAGDTFLDAGTYVAGTATALSRRCYQLQWRRSRLRFRPRQGGGSGQRQCARRCLHQHDQ
jgi:autotransporter-associated beta strand protein